MKKQTKGNIMLLIATLIWGSAVVAQSSGMAYVGPFTYCMSRHLIGFLALIPVTVFFRKKFFPEMRFSAGEIKRINRDSIISGVVCGVVFGLASSTQQIGISMTSAGKAGFITALYIVMVPVLGIFLKRKIPGIVWLCVPISLTGFYFLCMDSALSVSTGDLFCLLGAFCFSLHILTIDRFAARLIDGVMMSCVQFLTAGVLSAVMAFIFEDPSWKSIRAAGGPILYAGLLSNGVAFTLQVVAQRYAELTSATLLMSMESVFAALSGWLFLKEIMSIRELFGCLLVFCAVILIQIPIIYKEKTGIKEQKYRDEG